jgi:SAM-dependent methyltransferase
MANDNFAQDVTAKGLRLFDAHVEELRRRASGSDFDEGYYSKHRARFAQTLEIVPRAPHESSRALELGATDFFQVTLKHLYGYAEVFGTQFSTRVEEKIHRRTINIENLASVNMMFSVNLENELLPLPDEYLDLVMCCEVLEHMDIDPMFMLAELNRVCRLGAALVLTTPNCCSARNFWKIAHGWRPHFFMQYEVSRSPYRHNIEWDVHAVAQLARAAGFEPESLQTHDVFEEPMPEALNLLEANGLPTIHRGDCIFMVARKVSGVVDRWPAGVYV